MEIALRFIVGGLFVSIFAMLGEALRPKSFAGLMGAAPSVALATISLTVIGKGKSFAALEARSMILGAAAFLIYACLVSRCLMRRKWSAVMTTSLLLVVWLCSAVGLWYVVIGS